MHYKFPSSGSNISAGSLSSMIDIIFLLIIFFVVTASFDREQIDSKVTLPQISSTAVKSLPPDRLMLNVLTDGSVKIGFEHLPASDVPEKLSASMRKMKANPNTVLIINGDRDTPHKYISEVLNIAAMNGYSKARINAEIKMKGH
ncbi:MAG: biopolymer transporter ExbD [Lentisphaeria bacterium]|nr:biopolymer transporter ExbD [Lentisphaeria bacterium]